MIKNTLFAIIFTVFFVSLASATNKTTHASGKMYIQSYADNLGNTINTAPTTLATVINAHYTLVYSGKSLKIPLANGVTVPCTIKKNKTDICDTTLSGVDFNSGATNCDVEYYIKVIPGTKKSYFGYVESINCDQGWSVVGYAGNLTVK